MSRVGRTLGKRGARHERTGDVAPECTRAKETPRQSNLFEVECGEKPPAHALQIQVGSLADRSVAL